MPTIKEANAGDHWCPFNNFAPCVGAKCMAWAEVGRPYEYAETTDLVETPEGERPSGDAPTMPDGDGWKADGMERQVGYHQSAKLKLPKARSQRWERKTKVENGRCGRTMDGGYF
jgi:hypothetical protein